MAKTSSTSLYYKGITKGRVCVCGGGGGLWRGGDVFVGVGGCFWT